MSCSCDYCMRKGSFKYPYGHARVHKTTRKEAGGCNFCSPSRRYRVVWEVTSGGGHGGSVSVRFCRECLTILKKVEL